MFADPEMDESGCTAEVLERAEDIGCLLPYKTGARLLQKWGVPLSRSQLGVLSYSFEKVEQKLSEQKLKQLSDQPLAQVHPSHPPCIWMLEIDGVLVPTRDTGETEVAGINKTIYREVKSAVLYKKNTPSERYQISVLREVEGFAPLVHGLLRFAGVSQTDRIIGLSDGAVWIAHLFDELGVYQHILDVFHASQYLERVMLGLGWNEADRDLERDKLLAGQTGLQAWLNCFITSATRPRLNQDALEALAYLQRQASLHHTNYPHFLQQGFDIIGSGRIEGANKSVIGARLKVSGAQWLIKGADAKSFARAMSVSKHRILPFHHVRLAAFPQAA